MEEQARLIAGQVFCRRGKTCQAAIESFACVTVLLSVSLSAWPQQEPYIAPSPRSEKAGDPVIVRQIKTRVEPKYPELARQHNFRGKVRIEVTVLPDGNLKNMRELGGNAVLVKAVLEALRQWKFERGPKETMEIIVIEFK